MKREKKKKWKKKEKMGREKKKKKERTNRDCDFSRRVSSKGLENLAEKVG